MEKLVNVISKLIFIDSYTLDKILIKLGIVVIEKDIKYFLALIALNLYVVTMIIELTHYTLKFVKEIISE